MDRYGVDKPDLRFGMEIVDLSAAFRATGFRGFAGALESGRRDAGINTGAIDFPRSLADKLTEEAKALGAAGLVWMVIEADGTLRSPVAKFLGDDEQKPDRRRAGRQTRRRLAVGGRRLANHCRRFSATSAWSWASPEGHEDLAFCWVTDFPMFEESADGAMTFSHHPFTSPQDVETMSDRPLEAKARAYDVVVNGIELGSGSIRIHDP